MFHRLGHIEPSVTIGQRVKAGQQVGTNGTGNGQWSAHCHYDILIEKPASWNTFVIGWSRVSVEKAYKDPRPYRDIVMPTFDHYGYEWLEDAQYNGGHAYHPGIDLNGPGAGNADLGDPICSPVDGVVVHVHKGTDGHGGWGDMVVIEEITEVEPMKMKIPEDVKAEFEQYGIDINDNLDPQDWDEILVGMRIMRGDWIKATDELQKCLRADPVTVIETDEKPLSEYGTEKILAEIGKRFNNWLKQAVKISSK